jgi:hypothetical protein
VLHEALADRPAAAVDDVEHARRQPGLLEDLDEALAERGRVRRRFEDDRIAAHERGRDLPAGNGDRKVPRCDRPDDPDRHADAHLELVRHLRRGRLAEETPSLACHVVGHVDRFLDVAACLGTDLPHLLDHELGELLLAVDESLADAEEDLGALGSRNEAPALVGALGGRNGAVDVLRPRLREDPDQLTGRRIVALERLAARGVHPLAADVVLEGLRPRRRHCSPSSFGERFY